MTLEEVAATLDLPTAEDVADLLRAHGVKGHPVRTCECPIAEYISAQVGRPVSVCQYDFGFVGPDDQESFDMPSAAAAFMDRFDKRDPAFADLRVAS